MQQARLLSFVLIVTVGAVVWGGSRVRAVEPGGADRRVVPDEAGVPYGSYMGNAPQGDAIRIFNFVRCVRGAGDDPALTFDNGFESGGTGAWSS